MNVTEKLLARAAGKNEVAPGEIVEAAIDKVMANDITAPLAIDAFHRMGGRRVYDPEKVVLILDHLVPANDEKAAELHEMTRTFAQQQKLPHFYDVGRGGVCHQVMMENHVNPGDVIVGGDSHTCTYGALGAFATGIGSTEVASVLLRGKLWFKVPKTLRVVVNGTMVSPVAPKDLILHTVGQVGADGATYMAVEFAGETVREMSVEGRMTLCNMVIEMGGKNGIVEPDLKTARYLGVATPDADSSLRSDADARYEETLVCDASELEPMVACPYTVDNVKPLSEIERTEIDQVLIGSCTNGRLEDLRIAAGILQGKQVKQGVRALVIPASQRVYLDALNEGLIATFLKADALVCNPACGPCYGGHLGLLGADEVCVSTSNRNFVGRMGHPKSKVYLASPATAASSAITGRITDPRQLEG
jgi:3-isopropylmalate/(R)-2-methylmalate dehydratase large subunit